MLSTDKSIRISYPYFKGKMRKEIIVLYGSQSGNAESIAKDAASSIQNLCASLPSTNFESIFIY